MVNTQAGRPVPQLTDGYLEGSLEALGDEDQAHEKWVSGPRGQGRHGRCASQPCGSLPFG